MMRSDVTLVNITDTTATFLLSNSYIQDVRMDFHDTVDDIEELGYVIEAGDVDSDFNVYVTLKYFSYYVPLGRDVYEKFVSSNSLFDMYFHSDITGENRFTKSSFDRYLIRRINEDLSFDIAKLIEQELNSKTTINHNEYYK